MTFIKDRPKQHKKCRWCGEWFQLPTYSKPTRRFCTQSCAASFRTNQPAFKKAQSARSKEYMRRNAKKMHDAVQALWTDPERRAREVERARQRSNRPEHLAWMQEHNKKLWADPEYRKRHNQRSSKMMKERWSNPEELAKLADWMGKQSRARWLLADPEKRRRWIQKLRIANLAPLVVKKKREQGRARMSKPEYKAIASASMKKRWADPEQRAMLSKKISAARRKQRKEAKFEHTAVP